MTRLSVQDSLIDFIYSNNVIGTLVDAYQVSWLTATSKYRVGSNVFEQDWDALILLDTCRVDALREVADEYEFLGDIDSIISVGSTSPEWIANTFVESFREDIGGTVYASANAFAKYVIEDRNFPPPHVSGNTWRNAGWIRWDTVAPKDFLGLEYLWQDQDAHPEGHTDPAITTDRAISTARAYDFDRFIVHYPAPHQPFTANADDGRSLKRYEREPFAALRDGESLSRVWDAYIDHLRLALDNVAVLLENLDAERVVISADHGEGFGEWGMYSHGVGFLSPHIKRVPWAETTAHDSGKYEPDWKVGDKNRIDDEVEDQLKKLGYR